MLGLPALFPVACALPAVVTGNGASLDVSVADVMGTGSEMLLFAGLLITPLALITGKRWFVPLRQWYGIMFAVTAITDATIASITTDFTGGPVGRLTGHTFLLVGLTMVTILIPLLVTANRRSMRLMGRHWKTLQRLTYVVWALLFVHLALLFNFGPDSGDTLPHQRVYQYLCCSAGLLFFRLPPVRRWATARIREGARWQVWLAAVPFALLFLVAYVFIANEEIFKGVGLITGHPINN